LLEFGVTKIKNFVGIDLGHKKVEIHVELFILMRGARIRGFFKKIYIFDLSKIFGFRF
jgi:hypothetical protein